MKGQKAYLTVSLTLCLTALISLYLVLMEGVRRNGARFEAACATEAGAQSILAEYHRELLNQYNLFAIDSSYGTKDGSPINTANHLQQYIAENLDYSGLTGIVRRYLDFFGLDLVRTEVTNVLIMSDKNGAVFRKCAIEAVKDELGLGIAQRICGWAQDVEVKGLCSVNFEEEKKQLDNQLENYENMQIQTEEEVWVDSEFENPTKIMEEKKAKGILSLVTDGRDSLSQSMVDTKSLLSGRASNGKGNKGNMECGDFDSLTDRLFFLEYVFRYLGCFGREDEENALKYQLEYLIGGKESDIENLQAVVNSIYAVREAANVLYLMSDEEKQAEIQAAAALACSALTLPELIPLVEKAILLCWASAESISDLRCLTDGGKIPLLKTGTSWRCGLESALQGNFEKNDKEETEGLTYENYLGLLIMLEDVDKITVRTMDMVEADIRKTEGNEAFRLDCCFDRINAIVCVQSSRGYDYRTVREIKYQ